MYPKKKKYWVIIDIDSPQKKVCTICFFKHCLVFAKFLFLFFGIPFPYYFMLCGKLNGHEQIKFDLIFDFRVIF